MVGEIKMICRKCGGNLHYIDGAYVCQSCGINISIADYYEDIDSFICYIESDSTGRRTKDSIIAQKIYHNLESKKIKTFYSRISASDLFGDDLQVVCNSAIKKSKAIIILGSQKEYFEVLISKYSDFFAQKVVIPVYIDMDAYHMPKNISAVQALDYNKIGADADLTKALLRALNREEELTYEQLSKKTSAKNGLIIAVIIAILIIVCAAVLYSIFSSKGNTSEKDTTDQTETIEETSLEDPNLSLYNEALTYMNNEEYEKAIVDFSQLSGYKDSDRQLQLLYGKYEGYYTNSDNTVTLHLIIKNNSSATVEVAKKDSNGNIVHILETIVFNAEHMEFDFTDSQENTGRAFVALKNDSISFKSIIDNKNNELFIGNLDEVFFIKDKSDKPFFAQITRDMLVEWINTGISLDEIKQSGYELIFVDHPFLCGIPNKYASVYSIKNTDIKLLALEYDTGSVSDWNDVENHLLEKTTVFEISAPASVLIPDRVGNHSISFEEDGILYVPYGGEFSTDSRATHDMSGRISFIPYEGDSFQYSDEPFSSEIVLDTTVGITSKNLLGEEYFNILVNHQMDLSLEAIVNEEFKKTYHVCSHPGLACNVYSRIESREDPFYIILSKDIGFTESNGKTALYKININTGEFEEIKNQG